MTSLIKDVRVCKYVNNDNVLFVCMVCCPTNMEDACFQIPTPAHVLYSYSDVVNHYYAKHTTLMWRCESCKEQAKDNTLEAMTQFWTSHGGTTFLECTKCDHSVYAMLQDAIAHRRRHWQADYNRIRQQCDRQMMLYTTCREPPNPPPPQDLCMFCTTIIESTADITPCCRQPLHWECAVMWAMTLMGQQSRERCMHCQRPCALFGRLARRFNEFRWPRVVAQQQGNPHRRQQRPGRSWLSEAVISRQHRHF